MDTPYASAGCAGRAAEEAVALVVEDGLDYHEDVMFMPEACFPFYSGAYMAYLMSQQSEGDSDGASCFFGLVEIRAAEIAARRGLNAAVLRTLEHLAEQQAFYDADIESYGCFAKRAESARRELKNA